MKAYDYRSGHKPQRVRQNILQQANAKGIYAVRRKVAEQSYATLQEVADNLQAPLHNAGRIFDVRMLGITIIGFSRFDRRHCGRGPSTASITEKVATAVRPIEVALGSLAIYGSSSKAKLGIEIISEELDAEESTYEAQFTNVGYALKKEYNGNGTYAPHLSIALLYGDHLSHFQDARTLDKLDRVTMLGKTGGISIILDPVKPPPAMKLD